MLRGALLMGLLGVSLGVVPGGVTAAEGPSRHGLRLWLDASDEASVVRDGEGVVTRWLDRSGGGHHAERDGDKGRPTLVPGAMNGRAVVCFDGAGGFRVPAIRPSAGPVTIFVVSRRSAEQASDTKWQRLFSSWDGATPDDNKPPSFCVTGDRKGTGSAYEAVVYDDSQDRAVLGDLGIGMNRKQRAQFFRGDIAEVLVYDRGFLAEGETQEVLSYLSRKWRAKIARVDEGWTRRGPLGPTPKRVTDALPLSDQENTGRWEPYAPMTDEFDGEELDAAKWWPTNPGWKGRQPALFTARNVAVRDGKLHLTMRKEEVPEMPRDQGYHTYTSAAVKSKGTVLYGYFEIGAKPMRSAGSSAFWFYENTPEIWTEIDVFEIGGGAQGFERKHNMNLHVFHTPTEKKHWSRGGMWEAPWALADGYHVYGLEWDSEWLRYFVDGVLVRSVKNTHWHQPLTLNFDSETMPGWFGLPKDGDLPSTFSIEYVRAWKRKGE